MTEGASVIACFDETISIHKTQDDGIEMPILRSPVDINQKTSQVNYNFCLLFKKTQYFFLFEIIYR